MARFSYIIMYLILISVTGITFTVSDSKAENFKIYNDNTRYDRHFRKYSKRFFGPAFSWQYFKAQAIAESRLKENASSHVGAQGLMQIMPRTYEEIQKKIPYVKGPVTNPRWNIAAGIGYDRAIWRKWKAKRPFQDKVDFMMGSYNAGFGNIIKAQKIAENKQINSNLWGSIELSLPEITGKHSKETISYVKTIKKIKENLR